MNAQRRLLMKGHNNPDDPNKNVCTLAVCDALGVGALVRYLHCVDDCVSAMRKRYTVRSRMSEARAKGATVGSVRKRLASIGADYYLVRIKNANSYLGHVLLLGRNGATMIDTDPRRRDARRITHLYGIWGKK